MGWVPPPLPPTRLVIARGDYIHGRIDVEEFERRVEMMLREGNSHERPWLQPPPKPRRL